MQIIVGFPDHLLPVAVSLKDPFLAVRDMLFQDLKYGSSLQLFAASSFNDDRYMPGSGKSPSCSAMFCCVQVIFPVSRQSIRASFFAAVESISAADGHKMPLPKAR